MVAVAKTGGQLITYSNRFGYSGMTGVFAANVKSALKSISGTDGPATVDSTTDAVAGAAPADGTYDVAYTMQTGLTRYAPMQPIPPKTITAKNTKPLYPTSSVSIATTILPIPKIQTTLTQSQTFSVSSRANTVRSLVWLPRHILNAVLTCLQVAAAAQPSDDMAKFLNRWKD